MNCIDHKKLSRKLYREYVLSTMLVKSNLSVYQHFFLIVFGFYYLSSNYE